MIRAGMRCLDDFDIRPHIAILDPSAFTVPYDDHLCRALDAAGVRVSLWMRPARRVDYFVGGGNGHPRAYETVEHFYRMTERSDWLAGRPRLKGGLKAGEHVWNMVGLCRRLRRWRPQAIHFQWSVLPAVDRRFLNRLRRVAPCLLTVHDANAFLAPSSRLQSTGWRTILGQFDHLIVHTRSGRDALLAKGIDADRVSVVPHGVFDLPERAHTRQPAPKPDGRLRLLSFGSIKPYKGLDVVIRALAALPEAMRDRVRLTIAGSAGELAEPLQRLAEQLQVDAMIEWRLGFIPEDDVPRLFHDADAAVFPYREIDASGALMTALPYGRAIIASRLGLFAELLEDGYSAMLVEPENPIALADAIRHLIEDPDLCRDMGARAAATAKDVYSWDRIARMTLDAYRAAGCRIPPVEELTPALGTTAR